MSQGSNRRAMRLSSIEMQKLVHEAYAVHYVLLNLGFLPDDVFAGSANVANWDPPGLCAVVQLRAQGKTFLYTIKALVPGDDVRFERFWTEFAQAQPAMDRADLDALVQASVAWQTKGAILGVLADKGFAFPAVGEKEAEADSRQPTADSFGAGGKQSVN